MRNTIAGLLGVGLLAAATSGFAQSSAAVQRPQWSQTFRTLALTAERAQEDLHRSWLTLDDGTQLISTIALDDPDPRSVQLRGFWPDGSERFSRRFDLDAKALLLLADDPASAGGFALFGADNYWSPPTLHRLNTDGSSRWQLTLPEGGANGAGRMLDLSALADGSTLAVQERMLTRTSADGVVQWTFYNGLDNQYLINNGGVATDSNGSIWLAGGGGSRLAPDGDRVAAVRRFSANGVLATLHTFLCASCSESRATAIDILPDGEVVVVGRSGEGEPGFVAFYRANGAPRLRVDTPAGTGYDRLAHDAAGTIYAFSQRDRRIVSLARDGTIRWQRDGADMSALEQGVLISRPFPRRAGTLSVDAVDGDGQLRWSRQVESSDGLRAGGARLSNGTITLLAQVNRSDDGCGISPRLITLAADGTPQGEARACTVSAARTITGTSANATAGVLGNLRGSALRLSPDAQPLWQYPDCLLCVNNNSGLVTNSYLYADGSAWLTLSRTAPSAYGHRTSFLRIDATGSSLSETEFPPSGGANTHRRLLLADAVRAIDISSHALGLRWSRVSASGVLQESREVGLPGNKDTLWMPYSRLWPDGSVSLAITRNNTRGCQTSPPSPVTCTRPQTTVLRFNANGSERWRADLGEDWPFVGFNDDGSALALSYQQEQPMQSRIIGADGSVGAAMNVGDIVPYGGPVGIGPVRGRYLINTQTSLYLMDGQADVVASRPASEAACCALLAQGEYGFLVSALNADAVLLSADDLSLLATFDLDGDVSTPPNLTISSWHLLDDGSIYTAARRPGDYLVGARLSRFAIPGSPGFDRVFLDRFD